MKDRPIRARRIDDRRIEVRGVIFYANDEIEAVRKYLIRKKPVEVKHENY